MSGANQSQPGDGPPQDPGEEHGDDRGDGHGDDAVIGRAFRMSVIIVIGVAVLLAVGVLVALIWTKKPVVQHAGVTPLPDVRERPDVEIPIVKFSDITREAGITFVHENGAYGSKLLPETMGSGVAFLDYDNDGDQDLLFVNSCPWPERQSAETQAAAAPRMALYRNDGAGHFSDVSAGSGLDVTFYGQGVAVGDYDNDGWDDVFISAVGTNRLFHNVEGTFREVTESAGVGGDDKEWSTGCGWFDYDNDGLLDLFVCNYLRWSKEYDLQQDFRLVGAGRAYGPPSAFAGTFPYLYHNEGGGTFKDVSASAGVQIKNPATKVPVAKSLGVTFVDLDGDGWLEIVVANDTVQNFVFHNKQGKFEEVGAQIGMAFDPSGNARGAMGIDSARFRNDETLGLAIGNFANEMTALYVSHGNSMQFSDEAIATGLGPPSRLELKFGLFFFDYDLDGRLDLLAANGHLEDDINKVQSSQQHAQRAHLFWNCGPELGAEFLQVTAAQAGSDLFEPMVGRGAAFADIDGDGDLDVVMTSNHGPARLLRNDQNLHQHWLRFKLTGKKSPRDAIGAWIVVKMGTQELRRQVMPTRSYLSQSELPVTIGIGANTEFGPVSVIWPGGRTQDVPNVQLDGLTQVEEAL